VNATKQSNDRDNSLNIAIQEGDESIVKLILKWLPSRENLFIGDYFQTTFPELYKQMSQTNIIYWYSFSSTLDFKSSIKPLAYEVGLSTEEMEKYWWLEQAPEATTALNGKYTIICVSLDELNEKVEELKLLKKGKKMPKFITCWISCWFQLASYQILYL